MKIITIVGARPQFIKASVVSRAIISHEHGNRRIEESILHTGQHYDRCMSQVFFDDLSIPRPRWRLNCSNIQPEAMANEICSCIKDDEFDLMLLYGDTNSTLAGALAAESLRIPIAHIEAGLRSFNDIMPEEKNRIETDKRSTWLFCPTHTALENLKNEGIQGKIYKTGDVMYDAALFFALIAKEKSTILTDLRLREKKFILATIHRAENTNAVNLTDIFHAFVKTATKEVPIILPLHPRTRKIIDESASLKRLTCVNKNLIFIEPVNYLDMILLEKNASMILTDSGGMQKEAYFHRTPCITLRNETEWVETVSAGWNTLVGTNAQKILYAIHHHRPEGDDISEYGAGDSAKQIIETLCKEVS